MKIYQSFSSEDQIKWIPKLSIPLDYSKLPPGTEYELFKHVASDDYHHEDFWGLVSWKFNIKSPISLDCFHQYCFLEFKKGADCAFINPMIVNESLYANPWEQGILVGHTGMKEIYDELVLSKLLTSLPVLGGSAFSFCNYFVANKKFWKRYFQFCDDVLSHLEKHVLRQSFIGRLYKGSANYEKNPELTMKPFIVERLFSSFIYQNQDLRVVSYPYLLDDYEKKLGVYVGAFCKMMSDAKTQGLAGDEIRLKKWHAKRVDVLKNKVLLSTLLHMDDPSTELSAEI